MHRIFGTKENAEYWDRKGAYLIPEREGKIGVAKTPRGFFLLGGGIEHGEDHLACIERECLEEVGYSVAVKGELCSAETYMKSSRFGYFHPIQSYYYGELLEKVTEPMEVNHELYWASYEELRGKLFLEMQNWALEQFAERERRFLEDAGESSRGQINMFK